MRMRMRLRMRMRICSKLVGGRLVGGGGIKSFNVKWNGSSKSNENGRIG